MAVGLGFAHGFGVAKYSPGDGVDKLRGSRGTGCRSSRSGSSRRSSNGSSRRGRVMVVVVVLVVAVWWW